MTFIDLPLFIGGLCLGVPLVATTYSGKARAIVQAIEDSQKDARLTDKACSCAAEVDQSQWTKQRRIGGILGRLVALPREFWIEFLPRLGSVVGVPVTVTTESDDERIKRIASIVFHAMKAELHDGQKEATTCTLDDSLAR